MRPLVLPSPGPCVWILGGVHGGEPAPIAAICEHGPFPDYCLVAPCVNPLAFLKGEHHGDADDYHQSFWDMAAWAEKYPPALILNLHEDNEAFQYPGFYLYHYGEDKRIPKIVLDAVRLAKLTIAPSEDDTWETERIQDGVIVASYETLGDPNIDEYASGVLGAEVIVAETPSSVWPVKARLRAHAAVLSTIPELWKLVNAV